VRGGKMKIFWSWQSDTPEQIGKYLVRDALKTAVTELKQTEDIEEALRDDLHLDQDTQGTTGSPDLVGTIFGKIEKSEVVVADVTIVGKTAAGKKLINSNVAVELGYALSECTDARVVLVFNRHYGTHEDLPFDLRHKGGAVVFTLPPEADRSNIAAVRRTLGVDFIRKLKPFLQQPLRIKEQLSVRAILEHRLERRYPLENGGSDDVFQLMVSIENDGEQTAANFKLQLDFPGEFMDGGPPYGLSRPGALPGFSRFEISNEQGHPPTGNLYRGEKSLTLIAFNYAIRDQIKRQHPEQLEKKVTATVFSGNMTPNKTIMTIAELASISSS
jgi:hypothetical protein